MQTRETTANSSVTLVELVDSVADAVSIRPGLVGSIGVSTNPELSDQLLTELSGAFPEDNVTATEDDVCAAVRGKINEFPFISKELNVQNVAEMVLKLATGSGLLTLEGVQEVFSRINYSDYSFAIGNKTDLYLGRDGGPLHVIDMRESLGQIVFMPKIDRTREVVSHDKYKGMVKQFIEVPDCHVWHMSYRDDKMVIRKYKVTKTKYYDTGKK